MSSIMRRRNGLFASSVMGMLLSRVRLQTPHLQDKTLPSATAAAACRSPLPRERFSPMTQSEHWGRQPRRPQVFIARTGSADRTPATPIGANPVVVRPAPAAEERPAGSLFGDRGEVLARGRYVACPARGLRV